VNDIGRLIRDPAWLPSHYEARDDTFLFAHLPKETQRKLVFIDRRFLDQIEKSAPARLRDLPLAEVRKAARPAHYVFHTAFCCSTLLARALDAPGVSMGLKEPAVLVSLSDPALPRRPGGGVDPLDLALDLLSRPLAKGETQIIKPSNTANTIAARILELKPEAKAIVLYSGLEAYLRATARMGATGRLFNRQIFAKFARVIPIRQQFSVQDLLLQTDLQIAAQVWMMQVAFLSTVISRFGPTRVRTLHCDTLLARKAEALTRLGRFFELNADAARWAEIASGPVFKRHAKRIGDEPFDPSANANADTVHAPEIAAILPWAEALAAHCAVPRDLGNTLFDED
jgi:hypothetical protein